MKKHILAILLVLLSVSIVWANSTYYFGAATGMSVVASGTLSDPRPGWIDGSAFIWDSGVTLTAYAGTDGSDTPYQITLTDASGDTAVAWLGSAGAGETLGGELVTDGVFEATTEAQAGAGNTVVGKSYKILEVTDVNYIDVGSPDNNVNTYFTASGVTTIDGAAGDDRLNNVTFTSWTDTADGLAPQTAAGSLTNKAAWDGSQSSNSSCTQSGTLVARTLYKSIFTVSDFSAGLVRFKLGNALGTLRSSDDTYTEYIVAGAATHMQVEGGGTFVGAADDVSVKAVTDPPSTGLHGVSTKNGGTRNWIFDATFNKNESSYPYEIKG